YTFLYCALVRGCLETLLINDLHLRYFFLSASSTPENHTLSLHDALPIYAHVDSAHPLHCAAVRCGEGDVQIGDLGDVARLRRHRDRKSTRLNSSHVKISYAVFCLKKKKKKNR